MDNESAKHRLKNSLCCCFRHPSDDTSIIVDHQHYPQDPPTTPRPLLHSSSRSNELPDLKEKCLNLVNRIGNHNRRRRRSQSADFRYDPLSYALNFEARDDSDRDLNTQVQDYSPVHDFTARLPKSSIGRRTPIALPEVSSSPRLMRTSSDSWNSSIRN